eukprot:scaffold172_cov254-Pinguiococcus_pyrenoidosus.AAC.30
MGTTSFTLLEVPHSNLPSGSTDAEVQARPKTQDRLSRMPGAKAEPASRTTVPPVSGPLDGVAVHESTSFSIAMLKPVGRKS